MWLIVCGGIALLIIGLVVAFAAWRWRLSYQVNNRLQALRSAGLPTSGAELDKWYIAVPDEENAALVMAQAFGLMRTYPDHRSN